MDLASMASHPMDTRIVMASLNVRPDPKQMPMLVTMEGFMDIPDMDHLTGLDIMVIPEVSTASTSVRLRPVIMNTVVLRELVDTFTHICLHIITIMVFVMEFSKFFTQEFWICCLVKTVI